MNKDPDPKFLIQMPVGDRTSTFDVSRSKLGVWSCLFGVSLGLAASIHGASLEVPPSVRTEFKLDPFYQKYADAMGITILSSEKAPDTALLVARDIVIHMLAKRPDLRAEMVKKKMR